MMLTVVIVVICTLACCAALAQPSWQPDQFPVGYWYGPPATHNNLEAWQTVADCNFTWAMGGGYGVDGNKQMLDCCQQLGIKALLHDARINWQMTAGDNWQDSVGEVVADYSSHPALLGYYLRDEPNYELFAPLGEISQEFQKLDPKHVPYINLFPTYANVKQLGTPTYADHLDKFLSIVKPTVLSYDHYCLMKSGQDRQDYFENLGLIREYGLRYGVPPWNIILSIPHFGYRDPTAAQMRWQVYTSLAYGMKGIMYFTYWTAKGWEEEGHVAIVDSEGKPARLYPIIRQLNAEMKTLGPTLLGLTSTSVFHTGDIPPACARLGTGAIIRLPDDAPLIIGFFEDGEGRQYAMIVNRDYENEVEFEATLLPHIVGVTEIPADDRLAMPERIEEHKLQLRLDPGDGKLFKLDTEFAYPKPPAPRTDINFQFDTDGDTEGWAGFSSLANATVADGILTMTFTGGDPYLSRSFMRLERDQYAKVKVRKKLPECSPTAQLFWTTSEEPGFADDKYLNFPVIPDGEWHEYEIPVAEHAKWKGQAIRAIRLDPTVGGVKPGAKVEIDWIVGE